jgi:hypothetical protein
MSTYKAQGFKRGSGESGGGFVSLLPNYPMAANSENHMSATLFMGPKDARQLAMQLLQAADDAETDVTKEQPPCSD